MSTPRVRPDLERIPSYRQGKPAPEGDRKTYKLSSNENPFPPLPSVCRRIAETLDGIHLYPSMAAPELTSRLAQRHGLSDPARIVTGAGAVEVLSQLIRATAGQGDQVMFAWRSFEAYPMLVIAAGATPQEVPLTAELTHNLPAMAAAIAENTRLVLVCSPNNPTGTAVEHDDLVAFLDAVPRTVLVVLDEAYCEFDRSAHAPRTDELLSAYPHLVVVRTFSKAYGLAGMRTGYAVAPVHVAEAMRKVALPFGVTSLAQQAALASLDAEQELLERVSTVIEERGRVLALLRDQGWEVPDSQGNFVWLPTGEHTARVADRLEDHGVMTRAFPGDGIRVTIGTREANDLVVLACAAARVSQ